MDGSLRNIARQAWCHPEVSCQNCSYARGFSEQEHHTTTSTNTTSFCTHLVPLDIPLLNSMLTPLPVGQKATKPSPSHHTAAVAIPPSNASGHKRTLLSTASHLWNELPEEIVAIRERDKFKTEVNAFLGTLRQHHLQSGDHGRLDPDLHIYVHIQQPKVQDFSAVACA